MPRRRKEAAVREPPGDGAQVAPDLEARRSDDGLIWPGSGDESDERAATFNDAWERHRPPLIASIRARLGDADAAEEIVQEAFARLWLALRETKTLNAGAWLFTVARNLARDRCRARRRHPHTGWEEWMADEAPAESSSRDDPASVIAAAERASRVQAILARLPRPYRQILVLRYWHGCSIAEAAALLTAERGRMAPTPTTEQSPVTEACVKWRLVEGRRRFACLWHEPRLASAPAPTPSSAPGPLDDQMIRTPALSASIALNDTTPAPRPHGQRRGIDHEHD
jgi:RNA polymerase sigma factor (sigma-70 family)